MSLDEIIQILKSSTESDWGSVIEPSKSSAYYLKNVNLRSELSLEWIEAKPFTRVRILYGSTTLVSFSIPVVLEASAQGHAIVRKTAVELDKIRPE